MTTAMDEPTVILACVAYAMARRDVLAMKRASRCVRPRDEESRAPCWQLGLDEADTCEGCKRRVNGDEFRAAVGRMQRARRKLHRAIGAP